MRHTPGNYPENLLPMAGMARLLIIVTLLLCMRALHGAAGWTVSVHRRFEVQLSRTPEGSLRALDHDRLELGMGEAESKITRVSPTVFRSANTVFTFSPERSRDTRARALTDGEAKFWLEPPIELASSKGLSSPELLELERIAEERQNEIRNHWRRHFRG
jgi:hypothetical protein